MSSTYCLIVEGSFPGSADWLADRANFGDGDADGAVPGDVVAFPQ